jgi:hypothetical protein
MEATKHSILTASLLKIPAAEIKVAEFAEVRCVLRRFPKDKAERDCYQHLLRVMRDSPDHQKSTKADLKAECRRLYGVTVENFQYCWVEAIRISGANWSRSGRRSR